MDLLVEKGDSRTYLSRYKVITTSFEESSPSVKRNNTQIQYRNGNVDFGGWHGSKKIDYVGYYRADDIDEEETLREKIYALLSDPDGYYVTQLKNDNNNSYERPGENTGDYFEKQVNRPSHKRFYVYASSLESELVGSYGGHVLYKISATFTTMKLPYGESVPRDLDVKPNVPYYGRNLLHNTGDNWNPNVWKVDGTATTKNGVVTATNTSKSVIQTFVNRNDSDWLVSGATVTISVDVKGQGNISFGYFNGKDWENDSPDQQVNSDEYIRLRFTRTVNSVRLDAGIPKFSVDAFCPTSTITFKHVKLNIGTIAFPWSPNPFDPEYNKWHLDTYYNTDNLVIPYAGTVPCSQLEQGFTVEFTAKEAGSNFKLNVNGTKLTYNGQLSIGDVLKLSGYEYTKNDISIVKYTNKAYFKLIPGIANNISSNLHGSIKILGFQELYA